MRPACASASSALLASAFGISLTPACCSICLACASPRLRVAPPSCARWPGCASGRWSAPTSGFAPPPPPPPPPVPPPAPLGRSPLPPGAGGRKAGAAEPLVAFAEPVAHPDRHDGRGAALLRVDDAIGHARGACAVVQCDGHD